MGINHLVRSTFQSQFLCSGHSFDDVYNQDQEARMDYKIDVLEQTAIQMRKHAFNTNVQWCEVVIGYR